MKMIERMAIAVAVAGAAWAASMPGVFAQQRAATKPAAAAPAAPPAGTLAQVMRGIYFPNANLIFDVQKTDPGAPKKRAEGSGSATDTYGNAYTGWEVVENAAVALTDGVDLILAPGRLCQNGKPVPRQAPDFRKFADEMRAAGRKVLAAARTKSQEKVSDATNDLADACASCHEIYRDKGPADSAARCTPPAR